MDNKVTEAVNWATKRLASIPSMKTQEQYVKVVKRLYPRMRAGALPGAAMKRNTRSVERAAFRFVAANQILKYAKSKPDAVNIIFGYVKRIEKVAKEAQKKYSSGKNPETGKKFPNAQVKKSKRPSLNRLATNWRETLIELSSSSIYANQIRVMAICGCRPEELEKGIKLTRQTNTITITITGAKCSDITDAGQKWRSLVLDSNHPLIGNISEGVYQAKASAIGDAISHFGKKISASKKNPISAYSLRHAAASNFKASGLSVEEIAAALGHRSTATMSFYGTKSRGSGMLVLQLVTAASPVRNPSKKSQSNKPKI